MAILKGSIGAVDLPVDACALESNPTTRMESLVEVHVPLHHRGIE
jgi:hypothetical protein